jgi:hypothetical protein
MDDQESNLFEELFEQIVHECVAVGLVQGKHVSVDGSFAEANAAKKTRISREQLGGAAQSPIRREANVGPSQRCSPLERTLHLLPAPNASR